MIGLVESVLFGPYRSRPHWSSWRVDGGWYSYSDHSGLSVRTPLAPDVLVRSKRSRIVYVVEPADAMSASATRHALAIVVTHGFTPPLVLSSDASAT